MPTASRRRLLFVLAAAASAAAMGAAAAHAAAPGENGSLAWVGVDYGTPWSRFTVGPRGANLKRRALPRHVTNLVAAPDGRHVVYQYGQRIFVARRDGSGARLLARQAVMPSWAPDSERVVYVKVGLDTTARHVDGGLFTRRIDGSGTRRITRGDDLEPAWSADAATIAFVRPYRLKGAQGCATQLALFVVPADGGRARALFRPRFRCSHVSHPDWAPRGNRLVVDLDQALAEMGPDHPDTSTDALAAEQSGINIFRLDGTRRRVRADGHLPTWSPDGREIAYFAAARTCAGEAAETTALCATTPSGAAPRAIAASPLSPTTLTWSPRLPAPDRG